jgi:fibronectin type 3 domain-containing protein
MRKNIHHIFLFALLMGAAHAGLAQNEALDPAVKVQGRATDRSIKLRWGPNTPATWQLANQYGYTIERIKLTENGKSVQNPTKEILNKLPIKPALQQLWEPHIDNDDYVAVAAQAIYGETFELTEDDKSNVLKVINKAKELESRFSFTLFSADQSVKAAQLSGLYFEDENIAPATRYLYRIYANIPREILKVDTGFVFLGLEDYAPLPKPKDFKVSFQDQTALLSWNGELYQKIYNSFWVERSDDEGKTFRRISRQPIVNAFSGDQPKTRSVFRLDSLASNDIVYHYRVMGVNAFGEIGPPSDVASGSGKPIFAYSASITRHEITADGKARLEWTFPEEGKALLKSFELIRVNQATKVQTELKKDLDKNLRSIEDEKPQSTNYYVIRAVDKYGRKNNSFPYLVQTEDSIPPAAPVELTGIIDTLGRVHLEWKGNLDEDLLGYSIYRANFSTEEFIQKPGPIITTNSYVDTVRLTTLTEKIFYKVRAFDKRFNPSDFSAVLVLKKPDKMPPVPPVLSKISSDSLGIRIEYIFSNSDDVVEHLLYRKAGHDQEWNLIKTIKKADTMRYYIDSEVKHKVNYEYTMLAVDDDGLESVPAPPVSGIFIDNDPYPVVESIFFSVDKVKKTITVSWTYNSHDVDKFLIYKSSNDRPLALFKSVDSNVNELNDSFGVSDSKIEYRVVAGFKSGERTRSSKPVVVKM